jgi:ComF family protein
MAEEIRVISYYCRKLGNEIEVRLDGKLEGSYLLLKEPYCKRCAAIGVTTEDCKHNHSLDGFNRAYAMGCYYPARLNKCELLSEHILKFKSEKSYATPLGMALGMTVETIYPELLDSQLLIPIPLSDEELAKRGYNQSLELVRELSRLLKIPYQDALYKTRTQGMTKLAWHNRHEAVNDLYAVKNNLQIKCKKVLLVDDVMTTGLTCSAAGRELKLNGAEVVNVIVAARTFYSKGAH